MNDGPTFAIIAGGGTAGHVSPGIAIASALVERGHPIEAMHYVGSERGIERELVPAAGFSLTVLPGRGIERKPSWRNVGAVLGLLRAIWKAIWIVRRRRPAVVVSLGGYASVPCALAAAVWRVPVVIAEQNAVAGAANRLVSRWAKAAAVSFPGTDLPNAVLTGNPVRAELAGLDRVTGGPAARRRLDIDDQHRLVTCYGGSLGARRINRAVIDASTGWRDRPDLVIRHVIGDRDWDLFDPPDVHRLTYVPVQYERDMASVLLASDLIVCRAGASTVAELAAAATPSILVPLPHAPGDHQTANALAMVAAGAAVLVPDAELDGDRLQSEVDALLGDPDRLDAMAEGARSVARPDAADAVAALAEEHARV
ncbi:MAG: undecaprenyldiphospho-muramoylpentapeptide beta-N-acetylglucosaminyltransferase [Acidimicrobiia bacterium]|nr:undecaprenyldiphospho-muramoylpentapeptide beta-N-acetylglucosaminyltransferase [Acidimicrobiia bacterium]